MRNETSDSKKPKYNPSPLIPGTDALTELAIRSSSDETIPVDTI